MNTTRMRNKLVVSALGAAAAAAGAPALLFLSGGTAQAAIYHSYDNDLFGPVVTISDTANATGLETCHYHSNLAGSPGEFPFDADVQLDGRTPSQLQILGIQTGANWYVTINCPKTGTSVAFTQQF